MKILKPKNREEWLKLKATTIGGSEISAICGLNTFMTPRDIWSLKTGRTEYEDPTWVMKLGIHLEGGISELWEGESGNRVIKCSADEDLYVHPEHNFLTGTPDRRYFSKDGGKGVLEVKTTSGIFDYDEIPRSWIVQLQWYMGMTGINKGTICWFEFRSREMKYQEYDFNEELFNNLVDIASEFYGCHIANDVEPDALNAKDTLNKYGKEEDGKVIEATVEQQEMYSKMKQLQSSIKEWNDNLEELKGKIKMEMKDAERIVYFDDTLFSWKANKKGSRTFRIK